MLAFLWICVVGLVADETGLSGKFRNLADRPVRLWWVSHDGSPKYNGELSANGGETSFQTYPGHSFFFSEVTGQEDGPNRAKPITKLNPKGAYITVEEDVELYIFRDDTTDPILLEELEKENKFMEDYYQRTGRRWLAYYPRAPPAFPMWEAKYVGQTHKMEFSPQAQQFLCQDKADPACRTTKLAVEIEVIALEPRAFLVKGFLSDFECEYVIKTYKPRLTRSTTGTGVDIKEDDVRTSDSAWLNRNDGPIADAIFSRAAEMFRMPPKLFWPHKNSESINVLRYKPGGQYTPHYDWGSHGSFESRFISCLLYFNTPEKGGTTSFPKGVKPDGSTYIHVPAIKGNAMFFYDLLEDGNVDNYSLHAGEPVEEGEKWVGAMWIWDPNVSGGDEPYDEIERYYSSDEDVHKGLSAGWKSKPGQGAGAHAVPPPPTQTPHGDEPPSPPSPHTEL